MHLLGSDSGEAGLGATGGVSVKGYSIFEKRRTGYGSEATSMFKGFEVCFKEKVGCF